MYYKLIVDGYIVGVGQGDGGTSITEAEYNELLAIILSAPIAPDGYDYMLNATTLEWELVEMPVTPEPEPSDEIDDGEAMTILMGGE